MIEISENLKRFSLCNTDNNNRATTIHGYFPSTLHHTILSFKRPKEEGFGKHSGKGENAGNQHFLLFP